MRQYAGRLQQPAQRRRDLPQTIAPDVELNAGPKQLDELLAGVAALRLQREPRQQHGDRSTRELGDYRVPVPRAQAAEKLYLPEGHPQVFQRVTADLEA